MQKSPVLGIIEDGYTRTGVIAKAPRLHPQVRFEWRPMLIEERMQYAKAVSKLEWFEVRREMAHWISKKLVSWDVKDRTGAVASTKPSTLLRLHPELFEKLFLVVAGERASDPDPDLLETDDPDTFDAEDRLIEEARKRGVAVAELREERDAGN